MAKMNFWLVTVIALSFSTVSYGQVFNITALEEMLSDALERFENITIEALPPISIDQEEIGISVYLNLTDILFYGISDLDITRFSPCGLTCMATEITFNGVYFDIGRYVAAGHILTMQFNGDSDAIMSFEGVKVSVNVDYALRLCGIKFEYGESEFGFDITKPVVWFNDLNEGTDMGQSINIIVSMIMYDVSIFINSLINGPLYTTLDTFMVDLLNANLCPENNSTMINY